ncbi:flap endonuclease Xni [Ferrimonas sp. YFM]|uniref:flap endonuclease Xni n=1 Tax=Ferrimonas sp. YFM TaxID=3028878 RepID=UPI0025744A2D|nr:flap endonuclease Xni [Ferrimonas sp. YFM]BDY03640.1 Flap endonuclease Xni [Ferrimonas sp. YFM]
MSAKVLLIDALNLVRRIHAAVPQGDRDALYERTQAACHKMIRFHQASHVVMVWDGENSHAWRQGIHPEYKAHRPAMPEELAQTLANLRQALDKIDIHSISVEGTEADDILGTLASKILSAGGQVVLASTDKGFFQLHPMGVTQWNHFDQCWLDADYCMERFSLPPQRMLEYWSLAGDSGNGIPGIPGIGAKTASRLLNEHPITELFKEGTVSGKTGEKLRAGYPMAQLSYKLAKLRCGLKLDTSLNQFRIPRTLSG